MSAMNTGKDAAGIASARTLEDMRRSAKRSEADIEASRKNLEGTRHSATTIKRRMHTMTIKRRMRIVLPPDALLHLSGNSPLRASRGADRDKEFDLPFLL